MQCDRRCRRHHHRYRRRRHHQPTNGAILPSAALGLDSAIRNATLTCGQAAVSTDAVSGLPRSLTTACCPQSTFPCTNEHCDACGTATCNLLASPGGIFMIANADLQNMSVSVSAIRLAAAILCRSLTIHPRRCFVYVIHILWLCLPACLTWMVGVQRGGGGGGGAHSVWRWPDHSMWSSDLKCDNRFLFYERGHRRHQ